VVNTGSQKVAASLNFKMYFKSEGFTLKDQPDLG